MCLIVINTSQLASLANNNDEETMMVMKGFLERLGHGYINRKSQRKQIHLQARLLTVYH